MMGFQGLLGKSSSLPTPRRSSRSSPSGATSSHSQSSKSSPEPLPALETGEPAYIQDESQLQPIVTEEPDLRELNDCLVALSAIFPDVQVEVFREMLSSFDKESRLAVVTEALLKNKMHWVRGRFRVAGKEADAREVAERPFVRTTGNGAMPVEERFRSQDYRKAVRALAYKEFKGLSRSTINAVLAEVNHSYTLARPTLVSLSSKSWRFSITTLFSRRKPTSSEAEHHFMVVWQSTGHGSIVPTLKSTNSPELDKELFQTLIMPIQARLGLERRTKDRALAVKLNNSEAEEYEALHDCECCFTSNSFEEMAACDNNGHFICSQCVRHATKEAVFGQSWQSSVDANRGTLRCLAATSDDCQGCIPHDLVLRAFEEEKNGADVVRKFNERFADDSLLKTNLPLVRCPFCSYAEINEVYLPDSERSWRLKIYGPSAIYTLSILFLSIGMIPFVLPLFLLLSFFFLLFSSQQTFGDACVKHFKASILRLRRRRLGLKFTCQNDLCGRASCMSCSKGWTDIHICHESSLLALRTAVELAMSAAIKRTCPRCNTSFVKSSGCNKLTCVCGYQMCYVCRKDIGQGEGYRHFCEHFRPSGGRGCTECDKCDLYRCEDDEVVVRRAREQAEREWVEREAGKLSADGLKRVLEDRQMGVARKESGWLAWWRGKSWDMEAALDWVVESIIE